MSEQRDWQRLLGHIIKNTHERGRLASILGVNPLTLQRWVKGESMPRTENLLSLARALPPPEVQSAEQKALVESLIKDFPSIAVSPRQELQGSASVHIPAVMYAQIIDTLVSTSPGQTLWSASDGIMQLALRQLDPNEVGIAITIATCMPPSGAHRVRSLRHYAGRGTSPWKMYLDLEPPFFGAESLAGYAATTGHLVEQVHREDHSRLPAHWVPWEESAVACPILRGDLLAGCMVVSSVQPGYFLPFRQSLIQEYTKLLTLAFPPDEFYRLQDIWLQLMPPLEIQAEYFRQFGQRVSDTMLGNPAHDRILTITEAERIVWKDMEEKLLLAATQHP